MEDGFDAWGKWLEEAHPDIYDRWLDMGCYSDFHPGWEHYAKEYFEEEYPCLDQEFIGGMGCGFKD